MDEYGKPVSQWNEPVNPMAQALTQAQIDNYRANTERNQHLASKPYFAPPRQHSGGSGPMREGPQPRKVMTSRGPVWIINGVAYDNPRGE
jgi:hypothetical protein